MTSFRVFTFMSSICIVSTLDEFNTSHAPKTNGYSMSHTFGSMTHLDHFKEFRASRMASRPRYRNGFQLSLIKSQPDYLNATIFSREMSDLGYDNLSRISELVILKGAQHTLCAVLHLQLNIQLRVIEKIELNLVEASLQ